MMVLKQITMACMSAAMLSTTSSVMAQSNVESRIADLQKQLQELRDEMKTEDAAPGGKMGSGTTFTYGGFIKADAMWSDYSGGPRPGNIGDEILVPSLIPIGGESEGAQFDSDIKTSRLFFKTSTLTSAGTISSHFEMDFLTGDGDERISNSAHPRLRHAFVKWQYSDTGSFLAGQTWSTFFNVGALPESVEFIGPTSGTIFNRQFQFRWTRKMGNGHAMFALENPSSGFHSLGTNDERDTDDNTIPDLVARYDGKAGSLSYSAAVVGRELAYDNGTADDSEYGIGVSLSGKLMLGERDNLKFMLNYGNLGRYIALQAFRDGVIQADGSIETTEVTGGFVAYQHFWSAKLRSTFQYAYAEADLAEGGGALGLNLTEKISNWNAGLLYSPVPKLTFGVEYISATRKVASGADGDLDRLQFMTKFAF